MGFARLLGWIVAAIAVAVALIMRGSPHQTLTCSLFGVCAKIDVQGFTSPGYEGVKNILFNHISSGAELGARTTLYHKGKVVFDVWGGFKDRARTQPWTNDTLSIVFSSTKVVTAIVAAMLVDRGLIDLETPIARYWPEFAQNGKDKITVLDCLRHESGIVRFDRPMTYEEMSDVDKLAKFYESAKIDSEFPRGTRVYHAWTYGYIPAVLVRKVDPKRRTFGQFIAEEISAPLGLDLFVGLPQHVDRSRVGFITDGNPTRALIQLMLPYFLHKTTGINLIDPKKALLLCFFDNMFNSSSMQYGTFFTDADGTIYGIPKDPSHCNRNSRLVLENGGAGGVANAASLAKLGALMANGGELNGVRLFTKKATVDGMFLDPRTARDHYLCTDSTFTRGGLATVSGNTLFRVLPWPNAAGWGGWGGSVFVWDPKENLAFSYTMVGMNTGSVHPAAIDIANFAAHVMRSRS